MIADSATELTADELTPLVQAEQVRLSVQGVLRIPLPHFFLDVCIAWTAWHAGAGAAAWVWLAVMTVCQVARTAYAYYLNRRGRLSAPQMLNRLSAMLVGLGAMHVWPIVMVFSRPAIDSQYLLTMILVGNAAGAISPAAGNTRSYLQWAAVFGGSLALAWFSQGTIDAIAIGILLVFLFAVLTMYVHDQGVATAQQVNLSESLRRESARAERERVRAEMERERAETERERAEKERERAEKERDRAERERERAERASEAKTRFFAAASHDLRQPLMALAYNAATVELLAQREGNETLAHVAEGINRALAESRTLLASLLEVSELDAGVVKAEMSDVDLRSLIERVGEAFAPVAKERGLALICKQDDDLPVVARTDLVLIRRIINNLINNAIKFTEHGSVTIETIAHSKGDSRVSVRVTDSGPGIPLEAQDRVFEEFYQVGNVERDRSHGLGLGLAIVRRLAALLNAEVTLFSEPGNGATFEVALPRGSELRVGAARGCRDDDSVALWHAQANSDSRR